MISGTQINADSQDFLCKRRKKGKVGKGEKGSV
jgi:hypothetical protein